MLQDHLLLEVHLRTVQGTLVCTVSPRDDVHQIALEVLECPGVVICFVMHSCTVYNPCVFSKQCTFNSCSSQSSCVCAANTVLHISADGNTVREGMTFEQACIEECQVLDVLSESPSLPFSGGDLCQACDSSTC